MIAVRMQTLVFKSLQISGEINMQTYECLFVRRILQKVK